MQGVIMGDKHTYRDWGLMLKSRPNISPPKPKLKLIDVPGSDHVIDLTQSLTGQVHYEQRTIKFKFITMAERERWPAMYSDILKTLHGQSVRIIMDDDPNFYYTGRVTVGSLEPDKKTALIEMEAQVHPYKYERFGEGKCL